MAKRLSNKEKVFVERKADGATGVAAVLNNYETSNPDTAAVIASQNLGKLKIQEALRDLGFHEDNAKRVVAEILNDVTEEPTARLNAADKVFKVMGSYAAEKVFNLTANASVDELKEIIKEDLAKFRPNK